MFFFTADSATMDNTQQRNFLMFDMDSLDYNDIVDDSNYDLIYQLEGVSSNAEPDHSTVPSEPSRTWQNCLVKIKTLEGEFYVRKWVLADKSSGTSEHEPEKSGNGEEIGKYID